MSDEGRFGSRARDGARGRDGGRRAAGGRRAERDAEPARSALPTSALSGPRRGQRGAPVAGTDEPEAPVVPARVRAIEEHGRKAGRFTVRLEAAAGSPESGDAAPARVGAAGARPNLRSATVSAEIVERLALRVGAVLGVPQVAALREASAALATYDRALNLLAFRARSSADLRRKLVEKGEPPALADQAVARLQALGLLNDEDYARQVARGRLLGGTSKRRVQQELWRRGVTRDVADEAVADVVADEDVDEGDAAVKVARRKAASLAKLDAPTRRRRLYSFLARRGYDHEAIRAAMKAVMDPGEADDDALDGDAMGED